MTTLQPDVINSDGKLMTSAVLQVNLQRDSISSISTGLIQAYSSILESYSLTATMRSHIQAVLYGLHNNTLLALGTYAQYIPDQTYAYLNEQWVTFKTYMPDENGNYIRARMRIYDPKRNQWIG